MKYDKTTISNGLRVITVDRPHTKLVALRIYVKAGSRYDGEKRGLAHCMEHMFFEGTKKYPKRDIYGKVESLGGTIDARTTREYLSFGTTMISKHYKTGLDILSDILVRPCFDEVNLSNEKLVIIEEIKRSYDKQNIVWDTFSEAIWNKHSFRYPVIGEQEIVLKLTIEDICNYYKKYFTTGNTVVIAVGNINHSELVDLVKKRFDEYNHGNVIIPDIVHEPKITKIRTVHKERNVHQTHFVLGWHAANMKHEDRYPLKPLDIILGTGGSSRLYQNLREKGIVYNVHSVFAPYEDVGYFAIYTGTSPNNVDNTIREILKEIEKIKTGGISKADLTRAKRYYEGSLAVNFETNFKIAGIYGIEELLHKIEPFDEAIEKMNKVNCEDILRVANRYLDTKNYALGIVGHLGG